MLSIWTAPLVALILATPANLAPPATSYVGLGYVRLPTHLIDRYGALIDKLDGVDYALQEVGAASSTMLWLVRVTHDLREAPTYEVLAVLEVPTLRTRELLLFGTHVCKTSDGFDSELVTIVADEGTGVEYLGQVRRAWRADRRQRRLSAIPTSGITCLNPGYGL